MKNILGKCFRSTAGRPLTNPRNFAPDNSVRMPQLSPVDHYPWHTHKQSKARVLSHDSMLMLFSTCGCLKHCCCLKVKLPSTAQHNEVHIQCSDKMPKAIQMLTRQGGPTVLGRDHTTSCQKGNNFNLRCRSWYSRGWWHQTCPPLDVREEI